MKLPKRITRWVDDQIATAWERHVARCVKHGVDPHDIDPPASWRENLHIWFPEQPDWERSIDWAEIWATLEIWLWPRLALCKLGWHRYGMVHRWENYAQCLCGKRRYGWLPRWAR